MMTFHSNYTAVAATALALTAGYFVGRQTGERSQEREDMQKVQDVQDTYAILRKQLVDARVECHDLEARLIAAQLKLEKSR